MPYVESIWSLIVWTGGTVAAALGGSWAIFRLFADKWLDGKFAEKLQRLRHEHDQEIQRLQLTINGLLDGRVKYQNHEFDVLPGVWKRLVEANDQLAAVVHPMQMQVQLNRMQKSELDEFLENSRLSRTQKEAVKNTNDKTKLYQTIYDNYRINDAAKALYEFDRYARENTIFMPTEIAAQVKRAEEILRHARVDKVVGMDVDDFKMQHDGYKKLRDDFAPLQSEIGKQIRQHLLALGRSNL